MKISADKETLQIIVLHVLAGAACVAFFYYAFFQRNIEMYNGIKDKLAKSSAQLLEYKKLADNAAALASESRVLGGEVKDLLDQVPEEAFVTTTVHGYVTSTLPSIDLFSIENSKDIEGYDYLRLYNYRIQLKIKTMDLLSFCDTINHKNKFLKLRHIEILGAAAYPYEHNAIIILSMICKKNPR